LVPCRRAGVYQIMSGKEGFAMIRGSVVLFALALSGCALSTTLDTEYHDYFVIAVLSAVSAMAIMAIIHDAIEHRQR
jgi:ABC-type Fe3+-siderophore transport system permease subunit